MTSLNTGALVILVAIVCGAKSDISNCSRDYLPISYLDLATEMIAKAKRSIPECLETCSRFPPKPSDCEDIFGFGHNISGIYKVWPKSRITGDQSIDVYCDMDTDGGGWTVIQRRGDFLRPQDYFYKEWISYKKGFGDIDKDFWLGNDYIFALSNQKLYSARFDLQDVEGNKRYALYDTFWIDDEDHKYTLHIKDYSGDAGDSMTVKHDNQKFSTKDQKNDNHKEQSCAQLYKGGWWYNQCHDSNLNGLYLKGKHESHADGVEWKPWKGHKESLEKTEIKIRSRKFRKIKNTTPM